MVLRHKLVDFDWTVRALKALQVQIVSDIFYIFITSLLAP